MVNEQRKMGLNIRCLRIVILCLIVIMLVVRLWFFGNIGSIGDTVTISGTIADEPIIKDTGLSFHVNGYTIKTDELYVVSLGDRVSIEGFRKSKLVITNALVNRHASNTPYVLFRRLNIWATQLARITEQFLPEREAALINGLVLGQKTADKEFLTALKNTGTIHILVVSGANLTMVAGFMSQMLKRFGKKQSLAVSLVVIWFYALLTGMNPPVVRGIIMVSFAMLAELLGRQRWSVYGLGLAAVIMLMLNPGYLTDISFQLSFAATLGIVLLNSPLVILFLGLVARLPRTLAIFARPIGEGLAATLAAQLFVDPLILVYFHTFSVIAPLANILVFPVVLYLTITGLILVMVGLLLPMLAPLVSLFILLPGAYFTHTILWLNQLPYANITFGNISWVHAIGYYICLFVTATWLFRSRKLAEQVEPMPLAFSSSTTSARIMA